jgi:hypothetical protein
MDALAELGETVATALEDRGVVAAVFFDFEGPSTPSFLPMS